MTLTYLHVIGAAVSVTAIVLVVLLTAPNLAVGAARLRAIQRVLCVTIVSTGLITGSIMLVWGIVARSENLMYFSMMPLVVALLTSNFMRRNRI